jgi:ribonuclease BN (tRNA processing enzyme)
VQVTVIGCSGSFPSPASPASCYLVEHAGKHLVLDLGSGALGPLIGAVDLDRIDAVLLSHLHPDHCLDLTGLHVARTYRPQGPPEEPLLIRGPRDTAERIAAAHRPGPTEHADRSLQRSFRFVDHERETRIGPFTVITAAVSHPVPAFAVRVEAGGRSLVYSGDTAPCDALVELSRGADLALFEASFLEGRPNPANLHMTARQAAEHATAAGVRRLVLTHLVSWNDPDETLAEGRRAYDGELSLAAPGMVVTL